MSDQPDPAEAALFEVPRAATAPRPRPRRPAATRPVARVAVDTPLPHLDRPFDYLVPESLDEAAVPGCRVRVRFNGQTLDGFLLERVDESDFPGRLSYLHRVVSPEPVLTPEIAELARAVADHYAGTLSDVLRLAVPPRHARVEQEDPAAPGRAARTARRRRPLVRLPGRPGVPGRAARGPGTARGVDRAAGAALVRRGRAGPACSSWLRTAGTSPAWTPPWPNGSA
ncbi:primosome assembly protein PriA, partial [Thermobifida cellulosilytica TB100]